MSAYYSLSDYLREKYGKRLRKICIDGGFTCPNRDGKCGTGGCIFCGERGAGEHIDPSESITEQVRSALDRARDGEEFIAYFQNFTNTYAPIDVLRKRYDSALIDDRIRVLDIGTRPDCITEDVCRLLAEYNHEREVWVELGLQTANDEVGRLINRGYGRATFERALELLNSYGLRVVVHIMIGLPTEGADEWRATADYIARLPIFGVKIHSVYVMRGTVLARMYEQNLYTPPTLREYCDAAAYLISSLPESVVVHRMTGDCPKGLLLAPEWSADKRRVLDEIKARL